MKMSKRKESNSIIWIYSNKVHCLRQKALFERKNSCILPNIINRNIDRKRRKERTKEGKEGGREGGKGKGKGKEKERKETRLWALTRFTIIFPQTKEYDSEGHSTRSLNRNPVWK